MVSGFTHKGQVNMSQWSIANQWQWLSKLEEAAYYVSHDPILYNTALPNEQECQCCSPCVHFGTNKLPQPTDASTAQPAKSLSQQATSMTSFTRTHKLISPWSDSTLTELHSSLLIVRENDYDQRRNIPVLCAPAFDETHSDGAHPG